MPGLQVEFINPIFEFSRAMNELQLNDAEFALLIAISIFSAGAGVGGRQASCGWWPWLCSCVMEEVGWDISLFVCWGGGRAVCFVRWN